MEKTKLNTIITDLAIGLTNARKEDKKYVKKLLDYYINKALNQYRLEVQKIN
jgi:hypothetical protein